VGRGGEWNRRGSERERERGVKGEMGSEQERE